MKKIFSAALVALSLAGCATAPDGTPRLLPTITNPVTTQDLAALKASYVSVQILADRYVQRYRDGRRCTKQSLESITNLCSRRSVVLRIQQADRIAQIALTNAENFIAGNPTLDPTDVLGAARSAIAAFVAIKAEMI